MICGNKVLFCHSVELIVSHLLSYQYLTPFSISLVY
uniref:Uncharacterized protein n=1 Tax=Anguilla anguilla TaxID=7936 RepID=A0A0E9XLV8_ANGAN